MIGIRALSYLLTLGILYVLVAMSRPALAQQQPGTPQPSAQEPSAEELAKKTQNPVADLISVPFQSNFNLGAGSRANKMIYVLNIQPVIPIHISDDWNLITRFITPIINQPSLFPQFGGLVPSTSATGLGDINPTLFLSPAKSGDLIWGLGPTFTFPTASDHNLGSGKWSMGPAGVVLTMPGHWVIGALMNNQWSVAGWGDKPVNSFLLQPFINYNVPHGWYVSSAPIMTANWNADKAGDVWTVPVGGGVGKLFRLDEILPLEGNPLAKLPINTQLEAYGNAARPEFGAKWQLRFQLQFLFPK